MSKEKKDLKAFCILFYVLAVLAFVETAALIYVGVTGNTFGISELAGIDTTTFKIVAIVLGVLCAVDGILEVILGSKGLAELKGTYTGTSHMKLAAILAVLNVIGLGMDIYAIVKNEGSWFSLINEVLAIIILVNYRSYCKKILAEKQ